MLKAKRKGLKNLLQEKVVNIGEYRSLKTGRGVRRIGLVSSDETMIEGLKNALQGQADVLAFASRFQLEQALKQGEWDGVLLDERALRDDTLALCEKLKRQNKLEDLFVIILSANSSKDLVRQGYEKGCDEWITRFDDVNHLARLLTQHM